MGKGERRGEEVKGFWTGWLEGWMGRHTIAYEAEKGYPAGS